MPILNRTTEMSVPSVLNLINPISSITGGKDYVPLAVMQFGRKLWGKSGKAGDDLTHLVFKTGTGITTAFGMVALARFLAHKAKLAQIKAGSTPGKKVKLQLNTTKLPLVSDRYLELTQTKKASLTESVSDVATWLPAGAFILASIGGYRLVDKYADAKLGLRLDLEIAKNKAVLNRATIARAAQARGLLTLDIKQLRRLLLSKKSSLLKKAWGISSVLSAVGLLIAAMTVGAGAWVFDKVRKLDKTTIEYLAAKKALLAYTKSKALNTNIDRPSMSADVAKRMQGTAAKQDAAHLLPLGLTGSAVEI